MDSQKKRQQQLMKALSLMETPKEMNAFFEDLCTPTELSAMADRWHAAQLIEAGVSYRTIYEKTGISTATVTRVARCISLGSGGYRRALELIKGK